MRCISRLHLVLRSAGPQQSSKPDASKESCYISRAKVPRLGALPDPQALRSGRALQWEAAESRAGAQWECLRRVTKATEPSICPRAGGSAPREEVSH